MQSSKTREVFTMLTRFYCTNIFSKNAPALIRFYGEVLRMPIVKTDDDAGNGVYFGFDETAPMLSVWDCDRCGVAPTGKQSFVFVTENLDAAERELRQKGYSPPAPVEYEWGTRELRLSDPDGNEVVIVAFLPR